MYAICNLSVIPVREEFSDKSEQVTQMLYGDICFVIKTKDNWCYIRTDLDQYEGWVDKKQIQIIDNQTYTELKQELPRYSLDLIDYVQNIDDSNHLQPICIGANVTNAPFLGQVFTGEIQQRMSKKNVVEIAYRYLNAPYLWGGKSPFGIDCSGLTQMVYRLIGVNIPRDAHQQVKIGQVVNFVEETEIGDLAFFDNAEGNITHVGLMIQKNYIIHAHGKVRVDILDHNGIFNLEEQKYTHKLRTIKRILFDK